MNLKLLQEALVEIGAPKFRYQQIVDYYFKSLPSSWEDVLIIGKDLRVQLAEKVPFSMVELKDWYETNDVLKFVFRLKSNNEFIEAVVMKHSDGRRTLCLSCQSGCPMACTFCATGTLGLKKNLNEDEIIDQVREVARILSGRKESINNIVYMGMGEPFANYEFVRRSIHILHDPEKFNIGWRKITVSTSGVINKIMDFAKEFPQVNLAISLHAAIDDKRTQLMPINKIHPLDKLMRACREYVEFTKRKIFFEYLVIDGFNDTDEDVEAINKVLNHPLYHLNLIRFHATTAVEEAYGVNWKAPSREQLESFMKKLELKKIPVTLRRSFGEKIDAACGMLALKQKNNKT